MSLAPALDCGGQEAVVEPEGARGEARGGRGVGVLVVVVEVAVLNMDIF